MPKSVISIRLEKSVVDALDQVGLQTSRSRLIETILELFLEQDFAEQRSALRQALMRDRSGSGDERSS